MRIPVIIVCVSDVFHLLLLYCYVETLSSSIKHDREPKFTVYLFIMLKTFSEYLFIMSYLFKSTLKLRNAGAGNCVHVAAVAALEEVVGYSGNHGSVVAAEFEWREDAVDVGALGEHCAEAGISCNSAAADNCF